MISCQDVQEKAASSRLSQIDFLRSSSRRGHRLIIGTSIASSRFCVVSDLRSVVRQKSEILGFDWPRVFPTKSYFDVWCSQVKGKNRNYSASKKVSKQAEEKQRGGDEDETFSNATERS